jgi:hypothetical protein
MPLVQGDPEGPLYPGVAAKGIQAGQPAALEAIDGPGQEIQ